MLINEIIFAVVALITVAAVLYVVIKGGYRAFRRHWILALVALFLNVFFIWALVELFIKPVDEFNEVFK